MRPRRPCSLSGVEVSAHGRLGACSPGRQGNRGSRGCSVSVPRSRGSCSELQRAGAGGSLASGLVFLGKNPSLRFPQCRILLDAFGGTVTDSTPADQRALSAPAPLMVREVWDFVYRNTRHPMRVVGLNRVALDEYPEEAVREAMVNAIAHRNYEGSARQILVKLFSDRLEILSPGEPLKPLTVAKIRRGNCQPCSRNPILGQYMNHLRLMDQRGSGIKRMKAAMLNYGLGEPTYDLTQGYFRGTFIGPGNNLDRLRLPAKASTGIPPAIAEQLTERQKQIVEYVVESGKVTTNWVVANTRPPSWLWADAKSAAAWKAAPAAALRRERRSGRRIGKPACRLPSTLIFDRNLRPAPARPSPIPPVFDRP